MPMSAKCNSLLHVFVVQYASSGVADLRMDLATSEVFTGSACACSFLAFHSFLLCLSGSAFDPFSQACTLIEFVICCTKISR
jgi:hypothetical protein